MVFVQKHVSSSFESVLWSNYNISKSCSQLLLGICVSYFENENWPVNRGRLGGTALKIWSESNSKFFYIKKLQNLRFLQAPWTDFDNFWTGRTGKIRSFTWWCFCGLFHVSILRYSQKICFYNWLMVSLQCWICGLSLRGFKANSLVYVRKIYSF